MAGSSVFCTECKRGVDHVDVEEIPDGASSIYITYCPVCGARIGETSGPPGLTEGLPEA